MRRLRFLRTECKGAGRILFNSNLRHMLINIFQHIQCHPDESQDRGAGNCEHAALGPSFRWDDVHRMPMLDL